MVRPGPLLAALRRLPCPAALRTAETVGLACGLLRRRWRSVAEANLRQALPALDGAARRSICDGSLRNLGRVALALAKLPAWSPAEIRRHVRFDGLEHFQAARAKGRGVLLLTAHLGNWELGALAHGAVVGPLSVMARPIENRLVDRLVERSRSAHGNRVIAKRQAARDVLRTLRANGTVGILADQHASPAEAVPIEFFGRPAAANKGFAQLALRSQAAVVPAVAWWDPEARLHVVEYGPAVSAVRTGDPQRDVVASTQRFQAALEERVRAHPDQWLWIHRRWKAHEGEERSPACSG